MNQNKESPSFNNPFGTPSVNLDGEVICSSNNATGKNIKLEIDRYIRRYNSNLPTHKKHRIIEATNALLSLIN